MSRQKDYFESENNIRNLKENTVKGAFYTAIAQIIKLFITLGSQIALARLLLPAEFGLVAMVAPVLGVVGLFNDLGLSQSVIQKQNITHRDVSALYWIGLLVSIACALVAILLSPVIAWAYDEPAVKLITIAFACQIPLGALSGHASALMARKMRFGAIATVEVLSAMSGAATSILLAFLGAGYWSLVAGQGMLSLVSTIGDRIFSGWKPSRPKWTPTVIPMLHFGSQLTGFKALSLFSMYFDNILIGILRGPGALGLFDKAFTLVLRPVGSITAPISRVAVPLLSRLTEDEDAYRASFLGMLQITLLLGVPGLIAGSVMANTIVLVLLGPAWAGSAPIIRWISIAAIFTAFSGSSYWIFTSQNRAGEQVRCGVISCSLILLSMLIGLPWGPVGIALSYAIFAPLVHGCFIWIAAGLGPVRRKDVFKASYPMGVSSIFAFISVKSILYIEFIPPYSLIIFGIMLSYITTIICMFIIPEGNRSFRQLLLLRKGFGP